MNLLDKIGDFKDRVKNGNIRRQVNNLESREDSLVLLEKSADLTEAESKAKLRIRKANDNLRVKGSDGGIFSLADKISRGSNALIDQMGGSNDKIDRPRKKKVRKVKQEEEPQSLEDMPFFSDKQGDNPRWL